MFVVAICSWPSQSAITVMSLPASSRRIAAVCRSVCIVIVLGVERRAVGGGGLEVDGEAVLDGVAAESRAGAGREQRIVGSAGAFGEPGVEHRSDGRGERRSSFLSSFADGVHVGAGAERDVLRSRARSARRSAARSGSSSSEHRVVAPAGPGGSVGGGEQRVDLGLGEVGDEVALGRVWLGSRAPAAIVSACSGWRSASVAEQRVDRREPVVAGADAVAAIVFEVVEERGDQRRVEVGDVERARRLAGALVAKPSSSRNVSR